MSGFALLLDFSAGVPAAALAAAERSLGGFALAGWHRVDAESFAASIAREHGAPPPSASTSAIVLFDGRLTSQSRAQLLREAGAAMVPGERDAHLIARLWERGAERISASLAGDFALAVYEPAARRLWAMRGDGGARGLYFVQGGDRIAVASRAAAAAAAAGVAIRECPEAIAAYFALRAPPRGLSCLDGVASLAPGARAAFGIDGLEVIAAPARARAAPARHADDDEAAEAWRALLADAIDEGLADCTRPGILLSGGLDSSTLAALAVAQRSDLVACSWTLPQTPDADEQRWIAATTTQLRLATRVIDGDGDWPLAQSPWPVEDDGPAANPYRGLHQRLYRAAAGAGCDALITGNFGDHLYPEPGPALRSAWRERGARWTFAQYARFARTHGVAAAWREPGWRQALRAHAAVRWMPPAWLHPEWRQPLAALFGDAPPGTGADADEAIHDAEHGRRFHCMHGIELIAPYRDRRVIDFAAALPAHFQHRPGAAKWLTRSAMQGQLPDSVRLRPKGGSLVPFFRRGVLDREASRVHRLLAASDARWPRYVTTSALQAAQVRAREGSFTESDLLLIWRVTSYELWWRAHSGSGHAVLASGVVSGDVSEALRD
jgi:asparagine synthase (glutamine-hydrolysing)